MSDVMIKVEDLGKKYIISHEGARRYTALRDVITRKAKGLVKKKTVLPAKEEFWALKDVSFEIKKGEAVGIIGRNGAGKSTLLKILSRITEPTHGRIEINGRVASLLEVGTGFHPELTGRENIFLNGAILGMSRSEIRKKFDEIVEFSGVEKFLDTPVKRYSSGMYVRLAFAVAAHLEPEILVVDEVLAVGDAEFQKKCLGKMEDVSKKDGRTILFVSHNMAAMQELCENGIYLKSGIIKNLGIMSDVIKDYLEMDNHTQNYTSDKYIKNIEVQQDKDTLLIIAEYGVDENTLMTMPHLGFVISDTLGVPICGFNPSLFRNPQQKESFNKKGVVKIIMNQPKLLDGNYNLTFWFSLDGHVVSQHVINAVSFKVQGMPKEKQLAPSIVGYCSPECEYIYS
jgi:lipopolysaccharide transport system ATP-binding protein